MNELELKSIWQQYDQKLEDARLLNMQSWALNLRCFEELQAGKVKSKLNTITSIKIFAVILGIIWTCLLTFLVYLNRFTNPYFSVSISIIAIITLIAVVVYIKQVIIIKQVNYNAGIVDAQQKLTWLQLSTIRITRILFLQTPFYCTWFWHPKMINNNIYFWLIAVPIALFFAWLSVWLYRNIDIKNVEKKWFKILFSSAEWVNISKAKAFLSEIEEYKRA